MEQSFRSIKSVMFVKEIKGYKVDLDGKELRLPMVTNFEFRMTKPISIKYLYFGNESNENLKVTFNVAQDAHLSSLDARCYIEINQKK